MRRVDVLTGAIDGRRDGAFANVGSACYAADDRGCDQEVHALSTTQRGGPAQSHQENVQALHDKGIWLKDLRRCRWAPH